MHIQQQKYAKNMHSKYYCKICDYGCSRKFLWEQHLGTRKHKLATEATDYQPENMQNSSLHICEHCGREYKQRSGLWRHKKKCQPPKTATVNFRPNPAFMYTSPGLAVVGLNPSNYYP